MSHHDVYTALVNAVAAGTLKEPFSAADFRQACPGFGDGTYRAFLWRATVRGPPVHWTKK
jgi:hypothetical protein